MGAIIVLDAILVPLSLFVTIGYHAYLWHSFKNKPSLTTFGIDTLRRKVWFLDMKKGDGRKGTASVQTLRNTLMGTILNATMAITIFVMLAALTNNTYNAGHLFTNAFFGSQSDVMFALKCGSASISLIVSFFCSSMAIGYLIEASFLINTESDEVSSTGHTQLIFERGFLLSLVGNRALFITFPLLFWMLGASACGIVLSGIDTGPV
ncbi:hypothetical protein L1049_008368 [Liquidambar formosana]|uniref:Uncharacterized protein n=1 Tax=Liquidambar formosana TaxID=63359 RepID=A0AAP0S452_LIQFO